MSKPTVQITLKTVALDTIKRELKGRANDVLDLAARRIERRAKDTVPVDTGALKSSIGVWTTKPMTRDIGDGVEYGIYIEKGTSRMAARPWLGPSVEAERDVLTKAWKELLKA